MECTYLGKEIDISIDRFLHHITVTIYELSLCDGYYEQEFLRQYQNVSLASLNRIVTVMDRWGVIWEGWENAIEYLCRMGIR